MTTSKHIGSTFGRLKILDIDRVQKSGRTGFTQYMRCVCDCGNERVVTISDLRRGIVKACKPCTKPRYEYTYSHPLYARWRAMLDRCSNPKNPAYPNYGGRGIQVCDAWRVSTLEGFNNFVCDMGRCPENLSIDRINNDGDYSPENCRWANQITQNTNKQRGALYDRPKRKRGRPRKIVD